MKTFNGTSFVRNIWIARIRWEIHVCSIGKLYEKVKFRKITSIVSSIASFRIFY